MNAGRKKLEKTGIGIGLAQGSVKTGSAQGAVMFFGAQNPRRLQRCMSMRVRGFVPTIGTDGPRLGDFFGDRHQSGHRPKRLTQKIHIQTSNQDAMVLTTQKQGDFNQILIKELGFVNANYQTFAYILGCVMVLLVNEFRNLTGMMNIMARNAVAVMGNNGVSVVSLVKFGLENQNPQTC
jgi:hypothetical protein